MTQLKKMVLTIRRTVGSVYGPIFRSCEVCSELTTCWTEVRMVNATENRASVRILRKSCQELVDLSIRNTEHDPQDRLAIS
jgi:hypothetical protein